MTVATRLRALFRGVCVLAAILSAMQVSERVIAADEESGLTIGAYQIYKTSDALWIVVDVDRIVERDPYAEPPTVNRLVCVRVFSVDSHGAVHGWVLPSDIRLSANENFSILARIDDDMFLVSTSERSGIRLTKRGKPLAKPVPIPSSGIHRRTGISTEEVDFETMISKHNEVNMLFRTQADIYGMGRSSSELPKNLARIDVEFSGDRNGWGSLLLLAKSIDKDRTWKTTLLDLQEDKHPCRDK